MQGFLVLADGAEGRGCSIIPIEPPPLGYGPEYTHSTVLPVHTVLVSQTAQSC